MSFIAAREHGAKPGSGAASQSQEAIDRRERLRRLALESIDLARDPYFMRNHLGQIECRLCGTVHRNEGSYLAHTQGRRHQVNLAARAAREDAGARGALPRVAARRAGHAAGAAPRGPRVVIGRPGYSVTKLFDPETETRGLLFEVAYPEVAEGVRPRHRFMSPYEQRKEPVDRRYQYVVFAAEPYETVAFKIPNRRVDAKRPDWLFASWDPDAKVYALQVPFKGAHDEAERADGDAREDRQRTGRPLAPEDLVGANAAPIGTRGRGAADGGRGVADAASLGASAAAVGAATGRFSPPPYGASAPGRVSAAPVAAPAPVAALPPGPVFVMAPAPAAGAQGVPQLVPAQQMQAQRPPAVGAPNGAPGQHRGGPPTMAGGGPPMNAPAPASRAPPQTFAPGPSGQGFPPMGGPPGSGPRPGLAAPGFNGPPGPQRPMQGPFPGQGAPWAGGGGQRPGGYGPQGGGPAGPGGYGPQGGGPAGPGGYSPQGGGPAGPGGYGPPGPHNGYGYQGAAQGPGQQGGQQGGPYGAPPYQGPPRYQGR